MATDRSIVPSQMNPALTAELQQEVDFFLKWGYLIIEDALSQSVVATLREALDDTFGRLEAQFTHTLLEQDDRFAFLLDHPPILARMKAVMGNCLQLHSATARVTDGGEPDQAWHRDGPWPVDPAGTPYGSAPAQINCGYYLDELDAEIGPIAIVPGSHRAPFRPPEGHPVFPDELRIFAKPGQAVLFDGWIFHRGVANQSTRRRRACFMCYQNAWMKSREPFDGPRVSRLREEGTPEQKLLLGGVPKW